VPFVFEPLDLLLRFLLPSTPPFSLGIVPFGVTWPELLALDSSFIVDSLPVEGGLANWTIFEAEEAVKVWTKRQEDDSRLTENNVKKFPHRIKSADAPMKG
jgi:hypothetical protein